MNLQYATAKNVSIDDTSFLQIPPLRRFYEKAPKWSRIALERGKGLTDPIPKKSALRDGKLIQFNSAKYVRYVVFDVDEMHPDDTSDYPSCFYNWFHADMPPPQLIIRNKINGHCQYFYELSAPVSVSEKTKQNIVFYLHAIRKAMTLALNADSAYTHRLSRNPFNNEHQEVFYSLVAPYALDDLAKNLDLTTTFSTKNPQDFLGLGRNNDIFHTVRFDAYSYKQKCDTYEQLYNFVLSRCKSVNEGQNKGNLLPFKECQTTAKSIAKWTWDNYNGTSKHTDKYITLEKAKIGKKGGKSRAKKIKKNNARKKKKALALVAQGVSKSEVARQLKIDRKTVTRWCKK